MPSYKHLTKEERLDIDRYHQQSFSCRTISKLLGRSHTTISREIKRNNKDWKYGYVKWSYLFGQQFGISKLQIC